MRAVELDAPPAEVWAALTEKGLLSEWLAEEVELEPREGGEIVCRESDGAERRGTVELVEEGARLAFEWRREGGDPSRVEFLVEAVATAARTRLTVIETAAAPAASSLLAAGWAASLGRLRLALGRTAVAIA